MLQKVKLLYPIIALFIFVNAAILLGEQELIKYKFVPTVINGANLLLFALTLLGLLALISAAKDPNPNVLVRTVMAFMGFRLIGLAVILVSYIKMSGAAISPRSVYAGLALYPLYTWPVSYTHLTLPTKRIV